MKKILGPKKKFVQKHKSWSKRNLGPKEILGQKKRIVPENILGLKNIGPKTNFGSKKKVWVQKRI